MSDDATTRPSGIDLDGMDRQVRPQDDLFGHVNGTWLRETAIPGDRSRWSTFDVLRDRSQDQVRELLDELAGRDDDGSADDVTPDAETTRLAAQVGALYASFMDVDRVEATGMDPVEMPLGRIEDVDDTEELWRLMGRLMRTGVPGVVGPYVDTDRTHPDRYALYLAQDGLGLPDESYYREESQAELRQAYEKHIARTFALAGLDDPEGAASRVMALETRIAAGHWDRVACRDAVKRYNPTTRDELTRLAPNVPFDALADGLGLPEGALDGVVVSQPSFLTALSDLVADPDVPLGTWREWLQWSLLRAASPYLSQAFVDANFDFYGRTLSGTPEQRERWRRGVGLVDMLMGEGLGRLYVMRHFRPEAKERMVTLVENLVEAYRRGIADLDWMSPATREAALRKLEAFTPKIGYPDVWRDWSGLQIDPKDLVGNVQRASEFETDREWAKLGGPVDRHEWFMSPQTVNAYYNPGMNEIVFPAAILQPPFFDADADDAANYGAIGSVIGHEIGHGFDDQGSRYDGSGALVDWWGADDRERFEQRSNALIAQYDAFTPRDLPDEHVNGALTVGENIGDLGGVTVAHRAYRISLGEGGPESAPVIDGMTGDQRFFAGWAQAWRGKTRPQEAKRLLTVDPHSPGEFRANIVRNLPEFHAAYDVQPGDGLWLDEEDRVSIW